MEEINKIDILFNQVYFCLTNLVNYTSNTWASEESLIEDWNFRGLINREWGNEIISQETSDLLKNFRSEWLKYKEVKSFAVDVVFMFIDQDWIDLVKAHLTPALKNLEKDFKLHNVEYTRLNIEYDNKSRPSDEIIVSSVEHYFNLLNKYKIIEKKYMR